MNENEEEGCILRVCERCRKDSDDLGLEHKTLENKDGEGKGDWDQGFSIMTPFSLPKCDRLTRNSSWRSHSVTHTWFVLQWQENSINDFVGDDYHVQIVQHTTTYYIHFYQKKPKN